MVNIDNLVNEWAYRCKKGYPDMDSPSDLRVLKTILKEEGIKLPEQQLSLFSDDEMEKLLVKGVGKPIEKITAKDLTRYAEKANLNDEEISDAFEYLKNSRVNLKIKKYLNIKSKESNLLPKHISKFRAELKKLDLEKAFANYIDNPINLNIKNDHFADDMPKDLSKDKLSALYRSMGSTSDEKNVNIGPGEILFSILFKNAKKRETGGDLTIGSEDNVELKGSTGAGGAVIAKGYNRGKWSETKKKGKFEQFVVSLGMDKKDEEDALKYLDISKNWPTKLALIYDLYSDQDNFNKKKFESGVVSILSKIYNQSKWYPKGEFFNLDSYFSENEMNYRQFRLDLSKELIKEYMDAYGFDGILYIDKNGKIDYQKGDEITSEIGKSIAVTGPSDDVPRYRLKK
jgi:hypothetical protein